MQILTKLCFFEKISMERKNEKMKDHMEKAVITQLFKLISPNYMQWKHCEITVVSRFNCFKIAELNFL